MPTRKFPVADVEEIEWMMDAINGYEFIDKTFIHHSRWSVWYNIVFKYDDKYWSVLWPTPATESQESELYSDEIEAIEVEPFTANTTLYKPRTDDNS